jgi:excisionase family DNA binding protein
MRIAAAILRRLNETPAHDARGLSSIKEATQLLGMGRSTVYKLIGEGRLQTRHIGNRTLIPRGSVNTLLAQWRLPVTLLAQPLEENGAGRGLDKVL